MRLYEYFKIKTPCAIPARHSYSDQNMIPFLPNHDAFQIPLLMRNLTCNSCKVIYSTRYLLHFGVRVQFVPAKQCRWQQGGDSALLRQGAFTQNSVAPDKYVTLL